MLWFILVLNFNNDANIKDVELLREVNNDVINVKLKTMGIVLPSPDHEKYLRICLVIFVFSLFIIFMLFSFA